MFALITLEHTVSDDHTTHTYTTLNEGKPENPTYTIHVYMKYIIVYLAHSGLLQL